MNKYRHAGETKKPRTAVRGLWKREGDGVRTRNKSANLQGNSRVFNGKGSKKGSNSNSANVNDPKLSNLATSWGLLPDAIKAGILAMVKAATPAPKNAKRGR